jgi:hypothetical protein
MHEIQAKLKLEAWDARKLVDVHWRPETATVWWGREWGLLARRQDFIHSKQDLTK